MCIFWRDATEIAEVVLRERCWKRESVEKPTASQFQPMQKKNVMNDRMIYKIVSQSEWAAAEEAGRFLGSQVDLDDGYIHFSSREQVAETAAKHFAGQQDLLLVAVCEDKLGDSVRWEESRGGQLFPHLYSELLTTVVDFVVPLELDEQGVHVMPELT